MLDALNALDGRIRSAHSSVDRVDAVRVRDLLAETPIEEPANEPNQAKPEENAELGVAAAAVAPGEADDEADDEADYEADYEADEARNPNPGCCWKRRKRCRSSRRGWSGRITCRCSSRRSRFPRRSMRTTAPTTRQPTIPMMTTNMSRSTGRAVGGVGVAVVAVVGDAVNRVDPTARRR
ncbi:ribonuclease E Rne domain protein [Mycobacterium kansasii]|uniref:Ribonuclease E Rne domain protein n=1 Tax=Mycobacterium kansasii TaxID=1768 RepID=A0A1V3XK80_MYCKA|nr:ribonuclease E Rne domain protein [Mycobacterium kansasii]